MNKLFLTGLILILLGCSQKPNNQSQVNPLTEEGKLVIQKIDEEVGKVFPDSNMKSLSIGVIKNGRTFTRYFGALKNGLGDKPNDNTIFEIASVSKTFTGTLVAKAVTEGRLNLEDDIRLYLPREYKNLNYQGQPIRVKHLLTHTSGLPANNKGFNNIPSGLSFSEASRLFNEIELSQTKQNFFDYLEEISLDKIPGEHFNYSNFGTNLTAAIVEKAYNKPFQKMIKDDIFEPLNMTSTSFILNGEQKTRLADGYNTSNEKMHHLGLSKTLWGAEGGIKSTVPDMMKYVKYHMNSINKIAVESHKKIKEIAKDYWLGYFWWVIETDGQDLHFQHDGGAPGTRGVLLIYPEQQIGVYLITNIVSPEIFNELSTMGKAIYNELKGL